MHFPFSYYLAAFLSAFAVSAFALPCWRALCRRMGLVDDPGHRKIHSESMPLAGGLAVITGIMVPLLGAYLYLRVLPSQTTSLALLEYGLSHRALQLAAIALGAFGMLGLGLVDDKWELPPLWKFLGQSLIALSVAASGVRITLFVDNVLFSYVVTLFWILTVTNSFNFMDNMNGLCTGLGFLAAWHFGSFAAVHGQYLVALLAFLAAGAFLGFLPYNFPRASSFLGDSGSHLIGYILSVLAILPHFYSPLSSRHSLAVLSPLVILALPLSDLVAVVIIRWRRGQPFYLGDNNHFSHRLVRRGWSKTGTVLFLWLLALTVGTFLFLF